MFAYVLRRVLATIPLLMLTLYLVHVGVSATTNPLADFYLCLPKCQQGYDRILEVYNLDVSIWLRPCGQCAMFGFFSPLLSVEEGLREKAEEFAAK